MSRRVSAKFALLGLFALASVDCGIAGMAAAADLAIPQPTKHRASAAQPVMRQATAPQPATGQATAWHNASTTPRASIAPRTGSAMNTDVAGHARLARARFVVLRAAMEREMSLHRAVPADELSALESAMTELSAQLSAVIQSSSASASNMAKTALELAQNWYQAGLSAIDPPAPGVTELPLPMSVSNKADLVAAALDQVLEDATPAASAQESIELPKKRFASGLPTTAPGTRPIPGYASRQ